MLTTHYLRRTKFLTIQEADIGSVTLANFESYSGRWGTQHIAYSAVLMLANGLKYGVIKLIDDQQPVSVAVERVRAYLANPSAASLSVGY